MSRAVVVPNPDYTGRSPRPMVAECHDRTPFITVGCTCGGRMHLHESQIDAVPSWVAVIDTRCLECGRPLELHLSDLRAAFAQMRADGWIA